MSKTLIVQSTGMQDVCSVVYMHERVQDVDHVARE